MAFNTIPPTCCKMVPQSVTAETSSSQTTRDAFRSDLQEVEDLLMLSFGPEGRAVLTQKPTGQMTITRSGITILRAVYTDDQSPRKKILLNVAEKLHEECGDGVKSLMFTIAAMFRQCEGLEGHSRVVHQLRNLQSHLSGLRAYLESAESIIIDENANDKECRNAQVIKTYFGTRFPVIVSSFLARLIHEWILKLSYCVCISKNKHADPSKNDQCIVKDFSVLCHYNNGSLSISDSYVKEGFLLNRHSINLFKSGHRRLIILFFGDESSSSGTFDTSDIIFEVGRLLSDIKIFKNTLEDSSSPQFMVLTPTILPEVVVFRLKRENIAITHGAPIDEVKYLSCVMARFEKELSLDFKYSLVEVIYEHGKDYTFFNIPSVFNVYICGPTKELRAEYAQACHYALQLLTEANKIMWGSRFVEVGGYFERNVHNFVSNELGLGNDGIPSLGNRMELLRWQKEKLTGRLSADESNSIFKTISKMFSGLDKDVVKALLAGIMSIPRKLPPLSESRTKKSQVIEPISLKLSILQHALASVIMIINIDGMVYIKSKNQDK